MGNGHGGARPRSGRPPGSASSKTREIADRLAGDGKKTPLEVMVENMRFFHEEADKVLALLVDQLPEAGQFVAESAEADDVADAGADTARKAAIESLKTICNLRERAQGAARDAAPYFHPRLSPAADGDGEGTDDYVPLRDRLKAYQREAAIADSAGKVVDLHG